MFSEAEKELVPNYISAYPSLVMRRGSGMFMKAVPNTFHMEQSLGKPMLHRFWGENFKSD